jgi:hypothetical protein
VKQVGWRTYAYIGVVVGSCLAGVVWTDLDGTRVSVDKDFYAAAAQVIPVLLLAMIVRIAGLRELLVASERQIEGTRLELLTKLADMRTGLKTSEAEGVEKELAEIAELESDIRKKVEMRRIARRTDAAPARLSETLTGSLFATLLVGAGGIATALGAIAHDPGSGALFFATAMSAAWVLFGVVLQEGLHFLLAGSLAMD